MSAEPLPLIIAGAGPVGMCAALEASLQGVPVVILESRPEGELPSAKCNTVAARTMELFRRFGIADQVRAAGLPDDYPTDVLYCTSLAGHELTRIALPSRKERSLPAFIDSDWRSPETTVRISQLYLEPILASRLSAASGVSIRYDSTVEGYENRADDVLVRYRDHQGTVRTIVGRFLIGADGGRSTVRKAMGVRLSGDAELGRMRSTLIRAPKMLKLFGKRRPAWMSWVANDRVKGNVVAINGTDTWLVHRMLPAGEQNFDALDMHQSIRDVLGSPADFHYEVLNHEDWLGRRMVAEQLRDGHVFIAGDAAHLWVPFAGYGMNAGIADGVSLAWLTASVINGWGGPGMLNAYQAERQPITDQASRHAMQSMLDSIDALGKNQIPKVLSARGPVGAALRAVLGRRLHRLNVPQFAPAGLNFGYYYAHSPIILGDGSEPPEYTLGTVTPSTVPGCRLPHAWMTNGTSVYDHLGPGYTLFYSAKAGSVEPLIESAREVGMPLTLLDISDEPGLVALEWPLLLVRQDQHVAWRGHQSPSDAQAIVAALTGRG